MIFRLCAFTWLAGTAVFAAVRVVDLKCEHAAEPLGIDVARPRLFWRVETVDPERPENRGEAQTAYQVLVAASPEALAAERGDLWDSGRIASDQTTFVAYGGAPLRSAQRVFWKVRAWSRAGAPSAWSAPASWTMGLLAPGDWAGAWICAPAGTEALLLRREFAVRPGLRRAVAFACGLGQYELFLNGRKVSEDLLTPGWTNYDRTTLYDTREVTALLRPGANAAGFALGNGMYHVVRRDRFAKFTGSFGPLRAILHLRLEYADGTVENFGTDEQWRTQAGPLTFSSIYGGEDFDARLEPRGWKEPGCDDRAWPRAVRVNRPADTLRGFTHASEPVRVIEEHAPVAVRELGPGVWLYDFGRNALFLPRLRVSGPAGAVVRMTPGEVVNDDGTIDRGTMGGAHRGTAYWQYTKGSDAEETWLPQFYVVGSRYLFVELAGSGGFSVEPPTADAGGAGARPRIEALTQVVVQAAVAPAGRFATSDPLFNRIHELVRGAQRSNMVSLLMDCPHREKLGWLEQTHLNGPALRYEWDLARLGAKIGRDMAEAQTPEGLVPNIAPEYTTFKGAYRAAAEWGAAFIAVPWQQYLFSGDAEILRTHYDAMKRYFAWLESRARGGLLEDGLGDWYDVVSGKSGRANLTPPAITATAFYFQDAQLLAQIAAVLGRGDEARAFAARAEAIRARFNGAFFHPGGTPLYGTGSQTSLALPLALGIAEPADRPAVLDALLHDLGQRGHATSGAIGFRYLLQALADAGRSDAIERFLRQDDKPGYGLMLRRGATTLTESWDASRGASWNHFFLGQVNEWFYGALAGLAPDPAQPGFKKFFVRPQPVGDLAWVEASHRSPHGPIEVRWERQGPRFTLRVHVPANTRATVELPADAAARVTESGLALEQARGVSLVRRAEQQVTLEIGSGRYDFAVER